MAINTSLDQAPGSPIRVIAKVDDAIDPDKSDWDAYKETRDESKLHFLTGKMPTVFLCSFNFDAKAARLVHNAMLSGKDESGTPQMAYGSWSQTIAKVSLKDIVNPEYVPEGQKVLLKKDGNGYVHDELLAKLDRWGVVDDIFTAYLQAQKKRIGAQDAKNS